MTSSANWNNGDGSGWGCGLGYRNGSGYGCVDGDDGDYGGDYVDHSDYYGGDGNGVYGGGTGSGSGNIFNQGSSLIGANDFTWQHHVVELRTDT